MAARGLPKHLRLPWASTGLHVLVEQPRHRRYRIYRAAVWPRDVREARRRAAEEERRRREYAEEAERRWREYVEQRAQEVARHRKRPPVEEVERWLSWGDGTVLALARAIRDRGGEEGFPILADALEEAGCADAELIGICRRASSVIDCRWVLGVLLETNHSRAEPGAAPDPATRPVSCCPVSCRLSCVRVGIFSFGRARELGRSSKKETCT